MASPSLAPGTDVNNNMNNALNLIPINVGVCAVHDARGRHVGQLKRIGSVWKFKAVGYTARGEVEPGGGPLTAKHNTVFNTVGPPEQSEVNARLLQG